MKQPRFGAAQPDLERARDLGGGNTVQRCFIEIHPEVVFRLRVFNHPVHVNDAGRLEEDPLDLTRQLHLTLRIGTVNLRHQC